MELVARPTLTQRWQDKGVDLSVETEVDWGIVNRAMRSLRPGLQRWTTKHSVGMCGVQKCLARWGYSDSKLCPVCGKEEESALHVPRCSKESVRTEWTAQLDLLAEWFTTHQTDPNIAAAIFELLWQIRPETSGPLRPFPPTVVAARDSQLVIGVQGLLEGRISRHWRAIQHNFYKNQGSSRSSALWAARLSCQLIGIGHAMWLHRNSIKHSEQSTQNIALSNEINEDIRSQFNMGVRGLHRDFHKMLSGGVHKVLARPLVDRQEWLKLIVMKRSALRRPLTPQRTVMTTYKVAVTPSP